MSVNPSPIIQHRPFTLIILDGWGYSEKQDHNAIYHAKKPTWDKLWKTYPHVLLSASGQHVGLPEGQMGNSEVGHLNIGAGRIVFQDLPRIDMAIEKGDFFKNSILLNVIHDIKKSKKNLHLFGLVSPGGVHSHEKHLFALLKMASQENLKNVYIHAFLDGRDTPPKSALSSLEKVEALCKTLSCGRIASVIGRYYAMDRDKRWDRTQTAYDMLTLQKAPFHEKDAISAVNAAYKRGETDEFVQGTLITPEVTINEGDAILFFNFRADRARQLSRAFLSEDFSYFPREAHPKVSHFVSMTHYATDIPSEIVFKQQTLSHILGAHLSELGLKQLRIAETEKYAHVTFFFNGGIEAPFPFEDRILIPSPPVTTYDLKPQMSAEEITNELKKAILSKKYDFIVCNYANPDMLGHTGNFAATIQSIEVIDRCLKEIYDALQAVEGEMLITADHGNAECMFDPQTQQPHTAHTMERVPLLYVGKNVTILKEVGKLSDVAPTLLYLMGLPIPTQMTGTSLFS